MDRLLMRMGRLGRLNLLFDRSSSGPGPTLTTDYGIGGPVADVLQRLSGPIPIFLWKSLDPFLLFRANRPFLNTRKHAVAWRDIQALRATAAQNGEYLWPEDWWNLSRLTQAQLDFLSTEFPDAARLRNVQILLRLVSAMSERERKAVGRLEGLGWGECSAATRSRLRTLSMLEEARRIRAVRGRFLMCGLGGWAARDPRWKGR